MTDPCHNCRRRRLKCDRSLPHCLKCVKRGQECLGYQQLFRWEQGIASRGKMAGLTFEDLTKYNARARSLVATLLQDLNHDSRKYLSYYLVLYDGPKHNPFRKLIPMTDGHPVLLQIMIVNSALHMSNVCQKSLMANTTHAIPQPEYYQDALVAKQRALGLLKSALSSIASVDIDVTLAVVLLFIDFELIATGQNDWKHHINGARTIIETLCTSSLSTQKTMSSLRSCLISNCLVFDILGSTLACPAIDTPLAGALSLPQDAEGNHCSSFSAILLQLIQYGAQLYQLNHSSSSLNNSTGSEQEQALLLLSIAQAFDPLTWATELQPRSPATDLLHHTHVASAHRAAVCIYLSRVLHSLSPAAQLSFDLASEVADIILHLSFIRPSDPLFTATTWPAFIAGAETNDPATQEWVTKRFQELWKVEPWGLIRGAMGVLKRIWLERRSEIVGGKGTPVKEMHGEDWIGFLRGSGVDWLVV